MIIVELAGDGHNDALMVFFVLLALFLRSMDVSRADSSRCRSAC